jgi:transaldolase
MRAAGVKEYEAFAREVLDIVRDRPISFEVFADDFCEMERQARKIAAWAENVVVKIPINQYAARAVDGTGGQAGAFGCKSECDRAPDA